MNAERLSRRAFLKISGLTTSAAVLPANLLRFPPPGDPLILPIGKGRVTVRWIYRYQEPNFRGTRLGTLKRDDLVNIYAEIQSPEGPAHNPRWYQCAHGYVYSAYIQRVDQAHLNKPPLKSVAEGGILGRITVPYTQSYHRTAAGIWQPLYRYHYEALFWITGVILGPDQRTWYQLTDDLLHVHTYVPAVHVAPLSADEFSPLAVEIPPEEKRIEISLADQTLTAYENNRVVLHTPVSTGLPTKNPQPDQLPTETPMGRFRIQMKMPSRHMGDGELTNDPEAYELPGVPWVCVFHKDGYALHGTYWHDNFGRQMSHGCVNLRMQDAQWLYRWTTPPAGPSDWYKQGRGTLLLIY